MGFVVGVVVSAAALEEELLLPPPPLFDELPESVLADMVREKKVALRLLEVSLMEILKM